MTIIYGSCCICSFKELSQFSSSSKQQSHRCRMECCKAYLSYLSCLLRRHCFCRVQYPYFMNMLALPNVALYFLIFIGSLFPLLVIKRCDTSQLKFKVCIYMNVYFRKSAATFNYLFLMTHEQKYWFFKLCINIAFLSCV